MATPDPELRYATDVFDANGVQTDWEISFVGGYINPSHVYAMSGVLDKDTQLLTDRTSHPVVVISESENSSQVRIEPAVAAGRKLYIYRSTPVQQMLVDYINGSIISKGNLNLANDQLLKIIQEMFDNLNIATLSIDQQIQTVINLNELIQEIYKEVMELLAAGGIVSVSPRVWAGSWTGDTETDDEFPMPGADVTEAGFYDVYVNGLGLEPDKDYEVIIDPDDLNESSIRFATVPAPGSVWFAVLRGFAKPYTGPPPLTAASLRLPIHDADGPTFYIDEQVQYGLIRCTDVGGCVVTVNKIPEVGNGETKMGTGSYVSITQRGGVVSVVGDPEVNLLIPAGCKAETRAVISTISLVCEDGDTNTWQLSGDLAKE